MKKRFAIFASGKGSNAKAIIDYFKNNKKAANNNTGNKSSI